MTTIADFVLEVLAVEQEPEETSNDYLQRVAFEIQSLEEEDWNKVPVKLQEWYNKTADILASATADAEVELEDLPTDEEVKKPKKLAAKKAEKAAKTENAAAEPEAEATEDGEVKEPKKRGRKPSTEPKKEKVAKEPKEPRGPIAANAVREILCEDMTTTLDELMAELEKRGVAMQRSSAQVVHLNTVRAFEVALEVGKVCKKDEAVLILA